jgi:predicted SAM-dependent methyltransferase
MAADERSGPLTAAAGVSSAQRTVLHVGCGRSRPDALHPEFRAPGWREVRLDIDPAARPDIVASVTDMTAIGTASMDAVWSSHNLEHLYPHELPRALAEFHRVLKPGSMALITVPDLQSVAEWIVADRLDEVAYHSPSGPVTPLDMLYGFRRALAQGGPFMSHHTGFTARTLRAALEQAGFIQGEVWRQNFALWARVFTA